MRQQTRPSLHGSDNGLSPGRRQAIICTSTGILLIGPLGKNFCEILMEIHTFSVKKMHLKMLYGKWSPFCLGLNVLKEKRLNLASFPQIYYQNHTSSGPGSSSTVVTGNQQRPFILSTQPVLLLQLRTGDHTGQRRYIGFKANYQFVDCEYDRNKLQYIVAASLISLQLLWWPPIESHYNVYHYSAVDFVTHAHCIVFVYSVGNKTTTTYFYIVQDMPTFHSFTLFWKKKILQNNSAHKEMMLILQPGAIITWCNIQSSAVIMRSNIVSYYIKDCRNWRRISNRCWIHKRHPIPHPNGQAMGCLLWMFVRKLTAL